jgi:putative ABC transport system permease protein
MGQLARVTRYRFRATFRRQLTAYLTVALLIGVIGGVAMASIAGARRTQSSYPVFLASTNPSSLTMALFGNTANGSPVVPITAQIRRIPGVFHVVTAVTPHLIELKADGAPRLSTVNVVISAGSLDGMLSTQDRVALISGHPWNQSRADDVVMTAGAAHLLGVHLGQTIPFGLYTLAQSARPGFGTPRVKPILEVHLRLVDIATFNTQLVQDDVDRTFAFIFLDHALMDQIARLTPHQLDPVLYSIRLTHGSRDLARVERQLIRLVPRNTVYNFHATSTATHQVELSMKPLSVALGAFGAIAALACLVLAAQAVSRLLRRGDGEREIMRALGASPRVNAAEGLAGALFAIGAGTALAVGVAVALSPLMPLGPVRVVYPERGFDVDGTVLWGGAAVLLVCLGVLALAWSLRGAPRATSRFKVWGGGASRRVRGAFLPVAGTVGVHFAVDPGEGRQSVPVRSVLGGTVLAVALVVSTLTFASGLSTLVSRPPLYGWNWDYALNPSNNVPPVALAALRHDPKVAQWSGASYTDLEVDHQEVPVLMQNVGASVTPPILSGHGLRTSHQIVLGAATLAQLHKRIGDTVEVGLGVPQDAPYYIAPTPLTIVGTATLPAVGFVSFVSEHTSMGTGALLPLNFTDVAFAGNSSDPNLNGPALVFVRMRAGVSAASGRADMARIARIANRVLARDPRALGSTVGVLGVSRPVQIVNYRGIGSTPVVLAGGLALGAMLALGLTLASSVRR